MDNRYRIIIHFLVFRDTSNREIFNQLREVYGNKSPCQKTINTWAARFRKGEENVDDSERSGRPKSIDLSNSISSLLEDFPFISAKLISKELRVPYSTIKYYLKNELSMKKYTLRWIPYSLNEEQKNLRVERSKKILSILTKKKRKPLSRIITGDESWFGFYYPYSSQYKHTKSSVSQRIKSEFSYKKVMVTIFFSYSGFHVIDFLPKGQNFNSQYMINYILKKLEISIKKIRPKMGLKGMMIHMDNAKPHKAKIVIDKINEFFLKPIDHPPYSPDISPCDFWLFGYLKEKLKGNHFIKREDFIEKIEELLNKITKKELLSVYEEWIQRLIKVIKNKGDYV